MNSIPDATVFLGLTVVYGIGLLIVALIVFAPFIIAIMRGHPNSLPILLVCLFLGWTFIGWFIALVWSFTSTDTGGMVTVVNQYGGDEYYDRVPKRPKKRYKPIRRYERDE